jgi:hypothetical protein
VIEQFSAALRSDVANPATERELRVYLSKHERFSSDVFESSSGLDSGRAWLMCLIR